MSARCNCRSFNCQVCLEQSDTHPGLHKVSVQIAIARAALNAGIDMREVDEMFVSDFIERVRLRKVS